jgi:hypothetical protein
MGKNDTDKKQLQDPKDKKLKDEKAKKDFNSFSYYLAWLGFFSIVGSSLYKLIKNMDYPQKDEYYK